MKITTKETERTIKETKTIYTAEDGTEFKTEEECREYEESAKFALKLRFKQCLTVLYSSKITEFDWLIDDGRSESDYYLLRFSTEEEIKNFITWAKFCNYYVAGNGSWWDKEEHKGKCFYTNLAELETNTNYILLEYDGSLRIYDKDHYCKVFKKLFDEALTAVKTDDTDKAKTDDTDKE